MEFLVWHGEEVVSVIRDLSKTLSEILAQTCLPPELNDAQIVFDRPDELFKPQQTTVDLFLYDIRENVELRSNEPTIERLNGQARIHRPPLRVACSYIVTAWPKGGEELALQEHRLLSQVLQALSQYPTIPEDFLQGSLRGQEPPLPMMTSQADGLKNPAEFWTALGSTLRPSLIVTATIAMDVLKPETAPMVITEDIRLGARTSPDEEKISPETLEGFFRIGGQVTDATNAPVANATVMLVEAGLTTETDSGGRYSLGSIKAGIYTLRVRSGDAAPQKFSITVPAPPESNYNVKLA